MIIDLTVVLDALRSWRPVPTRPLSFAPCFERSKCACFAWKEQGPGSVIARVWAQLQAQRAKDRQVFAFRFGPYRVTGPVPDARTEADIVDFGAEFDDEEE